MVGWLVPLGGRGPQPARLDLGLQTISGLGHHYRGSRSRRGCRSSRPQTSSPLLYTFRALLAGVHLLRTGEVIAHLPTLLEKLDGPDYLPALIEAKILGEHRALAGVAERPAPERLEADLAHWQEELKNARENSDLPEHPPALEAVHEFVVTTRLS
ncbi:DNA polymerase beta superfamily protein [Lentzea indica]|nr:nucleotidyltransferase domain-containing protein [Lentzea indica]